jgi:hypothetical protein
VANLLKLLNTDFNVSDVASVHVLGAAHQQVRHVTGHADTAVQQKLSADGDVLACE